MTVAPLVAAPPALASASCDALNQPAADGFYFKGRLAASFLQAGDVITITGSLPVGPSPTNYVPNTFYLGIGSFDAAPTVTHAFPGTLVYTVPQDLTSVNLNWATYPEVPQGTQVAATWTVSCQNAPKATPTLATQASAGTLLGGPVSDTATLAGGNNPTGTITFSLYGPDDGTCAGGVAFTSTAAVTGNGTYSSTPFTPPAAGTWRWVATYAGDGANNAATSPCNANGESVAVAPFTPPPATQTLTGDVNGPVSVGAGASLAVTDARVVGPITVSAGGSLTLVNSRVTNGIEATSPSFFSLCGSQIAAPSGSTGKGVVVKNATVPVRVGDPSAGCAGNRVAGDVVLIGNSAGLTLGANVVSGNVTVNDNTAGAVVVKGNTVYGTLGCSGNSPAPTNAGQPNTAPTKTGQCAGL